MNATDPFSTGYFYHLYNKSMDTFRPFSDSVNIRHFMKLAWYYRSSKCKISFSCYANTPTILKEKFKSDIVNPEYFQVEILSYCIMPTHYHLLLRQNNKWGIMKFMNTVSNAFTRFYNLLHDRKGPIFIPRYKSRIIHTEEQLIHVSRYIHLNPYSSEIITSFDKLLNYEFSSLKEYLNQPILVNTAFILNTGYFKQNKQKYKEFILNHADHQKSLECIKHVKNWE